MNRSGNEEGLLGLAFHPDYHQNGRFYVHYSASGRRCDGSQRCSVISEFRASSPRQARADSERRLLVVPQPYSNHNGGALEFGPDGFLYISLGDGGAAGIPLAMDRTETPCLAPSCGLMWSPQLDNLPAFRSRTHLLPVVVDPRYGRGV